MRKPASTSSAILHGLCPRCRVGKISHGLFGIERRCPHCELEMNQESGYFLGAMMIGFPVTSILTVPPVIFLKVMGASDALIIAYPFLQYAILGPALIYYAKIIWVHVGYNAHDRLNR